MVCGFSSALKQFLFIYIINKDLVFTHKRPILTSVAIHLL